MFYLSFQQTMMLDSQLYDDLTLQSLLRSLAFSQTLFRRSIFRYLIFGFSRRIKAREWSIIIFNNVWTILSSHNVLLLSKIHDLQVKISVFENFLLCSLFDRISCYGVLGSLKHARPPCKGPISVFFRFLISPSHHTVSYIISNCSHPGTKVP